MLVSKITAKSQTTLPSGVRKALGVGPGDNLAYVVEGDHAIIRKAPEAEVEQDPALGAFLDFLERDIADHPERLQVATHEFYERMLRAAGGIEIDPYEPIEGPVDL